MLDSEEIRFVFREQPVFLFVNDGKEVGRLSWPKGELEFTGNLAESAQVFFEHMKPMIDEYITAQLRKHA